MIGRALTVMTAFTGILMITALGATLIMSRTNGVSLPLPNWLLCEAGLGEDCLQPEIEALEAEKNRLLAQSTQLRAQMRNVEAMESAFDDFTVFKMRSLGQGGQVIHTGVKFSTLTTPDDWIESWCYLNVPAEAGNVQQRITIGRAEPTKGVNFTEVSDGDLSRVRISRSEFEKARALCAWP